MTTMLKRHAKGHAYVGEDFCLDSDVRNLEQKYREAVARGLELRAQWASEYLSPHHRVHRLLSHWANSARAGKLDWAIF